MLSPLSGIKLYMDQNIDQKANLNHLPVCNLAHYSFFKVSDPIALAAKARECLSPEQVKGTILIAPEGVNMNLASESPALVHSVRLWLEHAGCPDFDFKISYSAKIPFKKFNVKVKKEIITFGEQDLDVNRLRADHVSADEFEKILENPGDTVILDTRNDFEVEMGTFKGAVAARMKSFKDFKRLGSTLPKDKPIVMFCTGGVRCEKASAYLRSQGFSKVRQLKGGILRYLEEKGDRYFNGECFVFDERLAVDGNMKEWGS